jgi:uncharacterized protein (UPF0333 family)
MESAGAGRKGQASTEFLTMFSVSIMVLLISVIIYFMHTMEAQAVENALDATSLCLRVSTTMSAFYVLGDGAEYTLDFPGHLNYQNYSIWVNSERGNIKINYGERGVGCQLRNKNLLDGSDNTFFELQKNATLINEGEVVRVVQ